MMKIFYQFELLSALYLLSILINSFLIYAVWRQKKLSITSFQFVACLSCSDILLCSFGLPIAVIYITASRSSQAQFYDALVILGILNAFFTNTSTGMILIIAVDRFIHMRYLLRYREVMTKYRAFGLILGNSLVASHTVIIGKVIPLYRREFVLANLRGYVTYIVTFDIFYMLMIISIFFIHIATFLTIRKRTKNQRSSINASSSRTLHGRTNDETSFQETIDSSKCGTKRGQRRARRKSDREFAKGMIIVFGSMLFFFLPNICIAIINNLLVISNERALLLKLFPVIIHVRHLSYVGIVMNCSINAVILIAFSAELKRFTKQLLCCSKRVDVG
ncbi:adenosine receptor A3-like [Rhopilema esculentum]|uniref:adenosine receptor A3-like n=1 Tax=Rhopilema esculentum TaxID=499914 RepID=UPI0031DB91AD